MSDLVVAPLDREPEPTRTARAARPVWPVVLLVQLFLSLVIGAAIASAIWPGWLDVDPPMPLPAASSALLTTLVLLGFVLRALRRAPGGAAGMLGPLPTHHGVRWAIVCGVAAAAVALGCIYAVFVPLSYVAPEFVGWWLIDVSPYFWISGDAHRIANLATFVTIVMLAPVTEEILFRGLILGAWSARWGVPVAIGLSSALFAALHADVLGILIFAWVLCRARLRFGSLWVPMLAHAVNNLIAWLWCAAEVLVRGGSTATLAELQGSWWVGALGFAVGVPLLSRALRTLPPIEPSPR